MAKKIRKDYSSKLLANIRALKEKIVNKQKIVQKEDELILSINDKIVWSYKCDSYFKVLEITTVSYVATIKSRNYTIIYYDNVHDGVMHSHLRQSIQNDSDSPISLPVKKGGDQGALLHWAIKDILNNWYFYRRKFYIRSSLNQDF